MNNNPFGTQRGPQPGYNMQPSYNPQNMTYPTQQPGVRSQTMSYSGGVGYPSQHQPFDPKMGFNPSNGGNPMVADHNRDGRITEIDYVMGARQMGLGPMGESTARAAFRYHDRDRNGVLDGQEATLARVGF